MAAPSLPALAMAPPREVAPVESGAARRPPELDELTVRRAAQGEAAAFRRLVLRCQKPVFALLGRMLRDQSTVEDLAQETFVRVHRGLPSFVADGRLQIGAWVLTIAARLGIDELRRRPLRPLPLDRGARQVPDERAADRLTWRRRLGAAIERAVEELPPEYRAAFLLREVHGLDYQDIASALEVDLGTVKSRLSRARAALRTALAEYHDED